VPCGQLHRSQANIEISVVVVGIVLVVEPVPFQDWAGGREGIFLRMKEDWTRER
jgi:hypothetical protein